MLRRTVPASGEAIPAVGLGTWQSLDIESRADFKDAVESMKLFVREGGTVIDSSPMYRKSESVIGKLIAELDLSGKVFLATKVWTRGKTQGIHQMEESFHLMGTQKMDLMQIHNLVDAETHLKTLRDWKEAGRIRYWGITHYHEGAHADMEAFMKAHRPDFIQINYSLAEPQSGKRLLPLARDLGVAVIANRPFAEGALFKQVQGKSLPAWAADWEIRSWAQFFLKWILADTAVTCAIPATRKPEYLLDNMAAGFGRLPDGDSRARMAEHMRHL